MVRHNERKCRVVQYCFVLLFFNCREHDKGPAEFAEVLLNLKDKGYCFKVSLLGKQSDDIPGNSKFDIRTCVCAHI